MVIYSSQFEGFQDFNPFNTINLIKHVTLHYWIK